MEPLQAPPALIVDHRLEFPAPAAQGPHPIRRRRQLRVHLGQQLHHLPAALAGRLLHQFPPRLRVQHRRWRRLPLRRPLRRRALLRLSGSPAPGPARRAARRAFLLALLLALLPVERMLQLRRCVQRHRAILQALPHAIDVRAEPHRLDAPPRCGVAVTQFAHRIIEQAREPAAQIQAALLNLPQVVDHDHFEMVFDAGQFLGPLQQTVV